jgi:hypothetical protein
MIGIHIRHADIEQHHRKLLPHQLVERFQTRAGRYQVLPEPAQDGLVGEQTRGLVIDQQNADLAV